MAAVGLSFAATAFPMVRPPNRIRIPEVEPRSCLDHNLLLHVTETGVANELRSHTPIPHPPPAPRFPPIAGRQLYGGRRTTHSPLPLFRPGQNSTLPCPANHMRPPGISGPREAKLTHPDPHPSTCAVPPPRVHPRSESVPDTCGVYCHLASPGRTAFPTLTLAPPFPLPPPRYPSPSPSPGSARLG